MQLHKNQVKLSGAGVYISLKFNNWRNKHEVKTLEVLVCSSRLALICSMLLGRIQPSSRLNSETRLSFSSLIWQKLHLIYDVYHLNKQQHITPVTIIGAFISRGGHCFSLNRMRFLNAGNIVQYQYYTDAGGWALGLYLSSGWIRLNRRSEPSPCPYHPSEPSICRPV